MKKILIVEDVELNVDLLVQILEDDYSLVVAGDGALEQGAVHEGPSQSSSRVLVPVPSHTNPQYMIRALAVSHE